MADTVEQLRGLVLSATELREMTDWPDALIEDYLNLLNNFITLAEIIDVEVHQKLEEVPTDFADGSIPIVEDGFVIEDSGLSFNISQDSLFVGGDIKGPNRVKQYFFSGF